MFRKIGKYKKWYSLAMTIVMLFSMIPLAATAAQGDLVTLAKWDFNASAASPTGGVQAGSASSVTAGNGPVLQAYAAGVTGGADKAINANGWDKGGGYWLASFVTTGYSNIVLSSKQYGSSTGPKEFKVQYSLDGTTWKDISNGSYNVAADWVVGVINNLPLPSETANKSAVYVRWLNTSSVSIGNGTVGSAGTNRIDDIIITATEGLPTPAPTLGGFTWNQGSASGTTVATAVPSGTLKYTVGAAGSQAQPNLGDTVTANTYGPAVNVDIPVTSGQHIFITRIDAQNKVTDWVDVPVLDANIKAATAPPATALTGFTWAKGTANGTTQATVVPGGTLKYVVGAAGSQTRPYVGDPATAYTLNLAAATDIAVTSGQHIFIVKLDAQSKITDWADVAVQDTDIKPIPVKTANPVIANITFGTLTTVSGSAGAVAANSTVSLYLDATSPTPVTTTTAAANGSFSISFTNTDSIKKIYLTAKDGSNGESDKVAVDLFTITKIKDLRVNDANGVNTLGSPVNTNVLYTIEGVATIKNNVIGSTNNNYYIQDDTSGVNIYSGTAPGFQIDPGVKVRVTGYLQFYQGLLEFTPTATVNLGTASVPAPRLTDIVDLTTYATGEPLEGLLVTVTGKVASSVASGANFNVTLVDANNKSVIVRVITAAAPTLGAGINVATDLVVGSTYTVTGVVGQNKSATPFTSGYQIFPRSKSDVVGVLSFSHDPITQVYKDVDLSFTALAQNAQSVDFYWRAKGDTGYTKVAMITTDNTNYTANILKDSVPAAGFEYYIEAKAGAQVQSSGDSGNPNKVSVIVDTDGPTYSKMLPTQGQKTESKLPDISLTLTDPSGVDKSSIVVKMDGTTIPSQYVTTVGDDVSVALQTDLSVGAHTIFVSSKDLRGNPSSVSWSFEVIPPFTGGNHYRGTTHNHTNISHDAAGDPETALKEAEKYHYDWFAFSDHSHDIDSSLASSDNVINKGGMTERTGGSDWQLTQKLAKDYTQNDKFVVFPAFEMTSTTWGHSNVFGTTNFIDRVVNGGAYQNLNNYYAWVMTYDDIVAQFNHPAMSANAFDNFIPYDKNVDKLFTMLEVGNGSGHYGYANAQDKFFNALDLGWHVAPTYGEDNHDATWGQTMKRTVIVAKDLSQDSLLSSMKNMHVYFTEDPNMTLDFSANGYYMGSILDRQNLDFHITGSDNVAESPTSPDYKFLPKGYKSNDNIAKVELITNGGRVIDTYIPSTDSTSFEWNPKVNVVGAQQWFVVKVTQKDGEQAYSAPIWTKEVNPDVRLSGIEVVGDAITGGSPATIKALVSNLGKTVASNLNVHLYYDQADAAHKIGDFTIADLAAKTMGYATFNWNNPVSGDITFIAVVDPPAGDDTKDNTFQRPFKIKPPLGITVMLDGAHGNENSSGDSGTYKDNFKTMIKILQSEGYTFVENKAPITPAVLAGVKVLMISHPKTALTASEQTAVADFVKAGGSLLLTEKSNNSADPTINNPILQAIGSDIRVNNDGVFDDSKDGNFWGDPKVSPFAVKAYPEPVGNYMTDIVRTIEYYSGSSLYKADGTKLTDSSKVTLLVKGNKTTYQGNLKGGAVVYNTDTNSNNGAQIPLIASEQIGQGRIVVSGMNIFNDKQQDTTFNYKGNPRFTLNVYNWLAGRDTVVSTIGAVRNLPDEQDAVIEGTVTSAAGVFYDAVYVQDATGGIMAFNQIPDGSLKLGDKVRVYGHTKTFENNKELEFGEFLDSFIKLNKTPGTPIAPKVATTKDSTNETNQGLLVKVEGKVQSIEDGGLSFNIDDGSGPVLVFTDGYIATQSGPAPNVKVGDTLQAVGLAGKYSAGTRIRVRDTKELIVTAKGNTVASTLSGTDKVTVGGSFDTTFGLTNVTNELYAQDITFTYDPAKVEFVSAQSVRNGFELVDKSEKAGEVRLIAASLGEGNAVSSSGDLLVLHWKAKNIVTPQTTIAISNVLVSNADGTESQLLGASLNVQIEAAVDKSALNTLITDAQGVYSAAVEGTQVGNYPVGSKAVLLAAITSAQTVSSSGTAKQQDVDLAVTALNTALQTFKDSAIKAIPGDVNGDGKISIADLGIVARYYGKKSSDANWIVYKIADVNNDGKIDIEDIANVAKKILDAN
ncbi:Ig domain-containing protein group 2 domain-containing protein [Paenibacillus sp. LMG 31457]|uniref:Ig domain-containing protein group 2 domain-containing protein n=2 Tax=Paenibacillus planticolens TaxID=2654976 RepID=A0ABX1ZJJ1_9BACL|nr:Ig domain-containing protein group 2 domain-containing protein [Paenibacillus planticolens]